jgi:predicted HAD superfamily Cof-like phosphohydrolase
MVTEFHHKFGLPVRRVPTEVTTAERGLRQTLLAEESVEAAAAMEDDDILKVAQELADVIYVAYGAALTYGIDLDAAVAEVHRANMSKLGSDGRPVYREDGKVLKSSNYTPPDMQAVLNRQCAREALGRAFQ